MRRWDNERGREDAPEWLNADEAAAWAAGWNAAIREAIVQADEAWEREQTIHGMTRAEWERKVSEAINRQEKRNA